MVLRAVLTAWWLAVVLIHPLAADAQPPADLLAEGRALQLAGKGLEAREAFRRARAAAEAAGDRDATARALLLEADTYNPRRDGPAVILDLLTRAQGLASEAVEPLVSARILWVRGVLAFSEGKRDEAGRLFAEAAAVASRSEDDLLAARLAVASANVAFTSGQLADAERLYGQAASIAQRIGARGLAANSLRDLGDVAGERGERGRAMSYYQEGLAAASALGDRRLEAQLNERIGVITRDNGHFDVALGYLEKALAGAEDKDLRASVLNNLGILYMTQGQGELGMDCWQRSLALYEEIGERHDRLLVLNNLGVAHLVPGKSAKAVEYFTKLLALDDEVGLETGKAGHWRNLGLAHQYEGRFGEARKAYEESLAVAERLGMADEVGMSLEALARTCLLTDDFEPVLAYSRRALAHFRSNGQTERVWRSLVHESMALRALGRSEQARNGLLEAIGIIERTRETATGSGLALGTFLAPRVIPYHLMADLSVASGDLLAGLDWADAAKARVLFEMRADRRGEAAAQPAEEALERRLTELNIELLRASAGEADRRRTVEAELARVRFDLEALRTGLYSSRPGLRLRRADLPALSAQDLAALVADGKTALLSYSVLDDKTLLLAVTSSEAPSGFAVRAFDVTVQKLALAEQVEALRRSLAERRLDFASHAKALYGLLMAPAEQLLAGRERLIVVADGALWNLPFHALEDASGRFVIDRFAVSYAPSLRLLVEMGRRARPSGPEGLLAVGNALAAATGQPAALRGRSHALAPLPDAEREVRSLARFYPPGRQRVLLGRDAAEHEVKAAAGRYGVLHFAGHAVLDDAAPLYSFLLLSPRGEDEDGLLETWEIAELDLPADLVVLSACETASGTLGEGEGLLGLTWAFMAAGARGVVASQWPVDSAATRTLMVDFHRGLAAGLPGDEALRKASLALRDAKGGATRHPFYWAPFVLVGSPGSHLPPVLNSQAFDRGEMPDIGCGDSSVECQGDRRDRDVQIVDRRALLSQSGLDVAEGPSCFFVPIGPSNHFTDQSILFLQQATALRVPHKFGETIMDLGCHGRAENDRPGLDEAKASERARYAMHDRGECAGVQQQHQKGEPFRLRRDAARSLSKPLALDRRSCRSAAAKRVSSKKPVGHSRRFRSVSRQASTISRLRLTPLSDAR